MEITLLILLAVAPLGALDVVYYHLYTFKLYSRRQSRREEITHLVRGVLFPLGLGLLVYGRPEGAWFWLVAALFGIELVNSLIDITLEPASRLPQRVPGPELVIHSLGATMMGAAAASFLVLEWTAGMQPTALHPHPPGALPAWLLLAGQFNVVVGTALVAFEAVLVLRHRLALRGIRA